MTHCKICGRDYDTWSSKAAPGFCSELCERSPFLPFPEGGHHTVRVATLLTLLVFLFTGAAARAQSPTPATCAARGQAYIYRGDTGTSSCVPHQGVAEHWTALTPELKFRIDQTGMGPGMDGQLVPRFEAHIIENLPESDTVGAPQSVRVTILGDCPDRIYEAAETFTFSGKMGGGMPLGAFTSGSDYEQVMRRVKPGSTMEQVFSAGCK